MTRPLLLSISCRLARRGNAGVPAAARFARAMPERDGPDGSDRILAVREIVPYIAIVYGITILLALLA